MTKKGLYEYLLDNYGANEVLNEAYNKITAKVTDQDAIDAKVKEQKNPVMLNILVLLKLMQRIRVIVMQRLLRRQSLNRNANLNY